MDAGHPAGRGDLAGDEELLLASAPAGRSTPLTGTGAERLRIFTAWSDEPWVNEGAAVRVSLICFGLGEGGALLNGQPVTVIHADLTADEGVNLTQAGRLGENKLACFEGVQKNGPFDIAGDLARSWLALPNPNGLPNSLVTKPYCNAKDIAGRVSDYWMIDFTGHDEQSASLFEEPFNHVFLFVKPVREQKREAYLNRKYWLLKRSAPDFRNATKDLPRYIITPRHAKYRLFIWQNGNALPDSAVNAIARSDDTTFGLLHSRFHELWSLRLCTWLGKGNDPRYTPTTTFETFPFPAGLTPADTREPAPPPADGPVLPIVSAARQPAAEAIAQAAFDLNRLREAWLNPPEWVDWVITPEEEQAGFPRRPVAKPGHEADLKQRTLTNLYNARPAWLAMAHERLDQAVAAAYGWDDVTPALPDEEILRRLLALNHERAAIGSAS